MEIKASLDSYILETRGKNTALGYGVLPPSVAAGINRASREIVERFREDSNEQ